MQAGNRKVALKRYSSIVEVKKGGYVELVEADAKIDDVHITTNINEAVNEKIQLPDMWSADYIGLYSQYAAVGLLYGSTGTCSIFCPYVFHGNSNLCANASNMVTFAWNFKILYAVLCDCIYPFGLRRRPWMILGFSGALVTLFVLAVCAQVMPPFRYVL